MADIIKTFKDQSRGNWHNEKNQTSATFEQINTGSLQRIADATEAIAKYHVKLIKDRDMYEKLYKEYFSFYQKECKRTAALRGVITKLKKKTQ